MKGSSKNRTHPAIELILKRGNKAILRHTKILLRKDLVQKARVNKLVTLLSPTVYNEGKLGQGKHRFYRCHFNQSR